jgi:hypothetical protein
MTASDATPGGERAAVTLRDVAERLFPDEEIVSISNPEPILRRYNVVAVAPSAEPARKAVLDLEAIEADDAAIGVVVLGSQHAEPADGKVDSEGVTRAVFPRVVVGGLVGFVVGSVLIGGGAALLGADSAWIGAALGGGLMGSVFGAIWVVFARLGGSDAYRQTFVQPRSEDLTLVSLHTDDPEEADEARRRLGKEDLRVYDVSPSGEVSAT